MKQLAIIIIATITLAACSDPAPDTPPPTTLKEDLSAIRALPEANLEIEQATRSKVAELPESGAIEYWYEPDETANIIDVTTNAVAALDEAGWNVDPNEFVPTGYKTVDGYEFKAEVHPTDGLNVVIVKLSH